MLLGKSLEGIRPMCVVAPRSVVTLPDHCRLQGPASPVGSAALLIGRGGTLTGSQLVLSGQLHFASLRLEVLSLGLSCTCWGPYTEYAPQNRMVLFSGICCYGGVGLQVDSHVQALWEECCFFPCSLAEVAHPHGRASVDVPRPDP